MTPFDWIPLSPANDGRYDFFGNQAYAVLALLNDSFTAKQVATELTNTGFKVGWVWSSGQASRGLYDIDARLQALPAPPEGWTYVYVEADAPPPGRTLSSTAAHVMEVSNGDFRVLAEYCWGVVGCQKRVYQILNAYNLQPGGSGKVQGPPIKPATAPPAAGSVMPVVLLGGVVLVTVGATYVAWRKGWLRRWRELI